MYLGLSWLGILCPCDAAKSDHFIGDTCNKCLLQLIDYYYCDALQKCQNDKFIVMELLPCLDILETRLDIKMSEYI